MQITLLEVTNFRCHEQAALELPPGLNLLVGPNGSGKTTLLEAIMLLATGRSPRTNWARELLRWEAQQAIVQGQFIAQAGATHQVSVSLTRGSLGGEIQKEIRFNGSPPESITQLMQQLPVVLFEPEDLQLVKGSPRQRRRFMNMALAGLRPLYLQDLQRYRRARRQRNELLKQAAGGPATGEDLAPWTRQLVQAGAQLMADRQWLVEQVGPRAAALYAELSGGTEPLELRYRPNVSGEEGLPERRQAFYEALEQSWDWELRRRATQVGPHRDDLLVLLGGQRARDFGSQGQQRTATLSLKLAQAQVLAASRQESPLVLLDDCLSELDQSRRQQVVELVGQFDQLILTTAGEVPTAGGVPLARVFRLGPKGLEM